jgi:hypothetical protein
VANDGLSSISDLTAASPGTGAASRTSGTPVRDTPAGTTITAEIPAVPKGPSYGVLMPDGSVWYPGSKKRLPAPLVLRVCVWFLAFAVLVAGAIDLVAKFHPSWLSTFRHVVPAASAAANLPSGGSTSVTTPTQTTTSHPASNGAIVLMDPQPTDVSAFLNVTAYWVDRHHYTVSVSATDRPAWVSSQPFQGGQLVGNQQSETLQPGHTFLATAAGADMLEIGAGGTVIKLYSSSGTKLIGTVPTPPHCPCHVLLEPITH